MGEGQSQKAKVKGQKWQRSRRAALVFGQWRRATVAEILRARIGTPWYR
jgi:hypothetical protein